jgi:hypothetical protein
MRSTPWRHASFVLLAGASMLITLMASNYKWDVVGLDLTALIDTRQVVE